MSEKTNIAWCDSTLNFWEGCTKISEGCRFCYAEARDRRQMIEPVIHWGKGAPRRKSLNAVKQALAMNRRPWICGECGKPFAAREAHGCGHDAIHAIELFHRRRIFSLSLGDWLDDEVPIEWFVEMLDTIRQCDQVVWMLCSKRWKDFESRLLAAAKHNEDSHGSMEAHGFIIDWMTAEPPKNIIGLCSVENQEMADKRIPQFLTVPLACHGLSLEPLLGPVRLEKGLPIFKEAETVIERCGLTKQVINVRDGRGWVKHDGNMQPWIDWLIVGGESGTNARPCNVDWIRDIVRQGQAAGVATFVKQLGAEPFYQTAEGERMGIMSSKNGLNIRHKKGGDIEEFPEDLRVRQFPKGF